MPTEKMLTGGAPTTPPLLHDGESHYPSGGNGIPEIGKSVTARMVIRLDPKVFRLRIRDVSF